MRILLLLLLSFWSASAADKYRSQYHFTPEKNWMNDPNGLVFYEGEYHLFYQYNPFGDKWGHMSWGHASSKDLIRWKHLPLAMAEENGVMIFSGSAVVDWKNTSGFGRDGKPPLVAIYTGHRSNAQEQSIAYSNDKGLTWTKYSGNPVIHHDYAFKDFRDPKVHWNEQRKLWSMVVAMSAERRARFYSSPDLKQWTLDSVFGPTGSTNGVWECPDLFELPVEGSKEKRWVLTINVGSGSIAGGSGAIYFTGQFDGSKFTPDPSPTVQWVDYGKDFYAAQSWSDLPKRDGRRIWIGWMANTHYAGNTPTAPFRSAMSIPRELTLQKTADGLRLAQTPVRELKKLRAKHERFTRGTVAEANAWLKKKNITGDSLEILLDTEGEGIKVFKGENEETIVGKNFIDRRRSGKVDLHRDFPGRHEGPKTTGPIHIFLDTCSVELFANDGQLVITDLVFPSENSRSLELTGPPDAKVKSLDIWRLH